MRFFNFFQGDSDDSNDSGHSTTRRVIALILVLCVGIFFTRAIIQLYRKSEVLGAERKRQELKLQALVLERERLENEITFLKRNGSVEREAKERLNYKKEGERVVVVVPAEKSAAAVAGSLPRGISFQERLVNFVLRAFGFQPKIPETSGK